MGREGNGVGMFAGIQAQVGEHFRNAAGELDRYANLIIGRLDVIAEGVLALGTSEVERVSESVRLEATETEKVTEARAGYMVTIEHIAVIVDAAPATVDIYVGSVGAQGFRKRFNFDAGATNLRASSELSSFKVPEGGPVIAVAGPAGANVNVQLKREKI